MTSYDDRKTTTYSRRTAGTFFLSAGIMATGLLGCGPAALPRPTVTAPGGRIDLGVASLDIITEYTSPALAPYIDHVIMPSPAMQVAQWASKTLIPADDEGNALLTIMTASMKETALSSEDGLKALFTNQQRLLVTVELEGALLFSHPDGQKSATLALASSAEKSIADKASPKEADEIRFEAIREALGRFDQELRSQLAGFNGAWPLIMR